MTKTAGLPGPEEGGKPAADGGIVCRWEQLPLGWLFYVACECGTLTEAVFEDDLEALGGFGAVEAAVMKRFRREHPRCPHLLEAVRKLEAGAVRDAAGYIQKLEDDLNVRWGV